MTNRTVILAKQDIESLKITALENLRAAIAMASYAGLLDDLTDTIHPDTVNAFCDALGSLQS